MPPRPLIGAVRYVPSAERGASILLDEFQHRQVMLRVSLDHNTVELEQVHVIGIHTILPMGRRQDERIP